MTTAVAIGGIPIAIGIANITTAEPLDEFHGGWDLQVQSQAVPFLATHPAIRLRLGPRTPTSACHSPTTIPVCFVWCAPFQRPPATLHGGMEKSAQDQRIL